MAALASCLNEIRLFPKKGLSHEYALSNLRQGIRSLGEAVSCWTNKHVGNDPNTYFMNTTFHFPSDSFPAIPLFVLVIWMIVWVAVLGSVLARKDFDPVTKLTWVLVVILVPFFGVALYWLIAPTQQAVSTGPAKTTASEPINCISCGTVIPAGVSSCPKCGWTY